MFFYNLLLVVYSNRSICKFLRVINYKTKSPNTEGDFCYMYKFPIVLKNDLILSYIEVQGNKLKLDSDRDDLHKLYKDNRFDIIKHNEYSYISIFHDPITCFYTYPNYKK